jgi:hypothetical protein
MIVARPKGRNAVVKLFVFIPFLALLAHERRRNRKRRERSRAAKERSAVYGKFLGKSCGSARSKASQTITRDKNPTRVTRPTEGRSAFVNKDITACVDIN